MNKIEECSKSFAALAAPIVIDALMSKYGVKISPTMSDSVNLLIMSLVSGFLVWLIPNRIEGQNVHKIAKDTITKTGVPQPRPKPEKEVPSYEN